VVRLDCLRALEVHGLRPKDEGDDWITTITSTILAPHLETLSLSEMARSQLFYFMMLMDTRPTERRFPILSSLILRSVEIDEGDAH
jgi:hypothetical protein